jgi:hypothetical protein
LFLGGWLSPVGFLPDGFVWLALKTSFICSCFFGSEQRFRGSGTTTSCAWAGRCLFR